MSLFFSLVHSWLKNLDLGYICVGINFQLNIVFKYGCSKFFTGIDNLKSMIYKLSDSEKLVFNALFVVDPAINLEHKISSSSYHFNFNLKVEYPPSYAWEVCNCCKTRFDLINRDTENLVFTIISTSLIGKYWTFLKIYRQIWLSWAIIRTFPGWKMNLGC